ncbi:MAG: CsbD family protein [Euryarchaeota archaeon]|nr:CsbD family protein [Euryarchaeota archaeon]
MKSRKYDQAESKIHKVKGAIKEIAGKLSKNPDLEIESKKEKIAA